MILPLLLAATLSTAVAAAPAASRAPEPSPEPSPAAAPAAAAEKPGLDEPITLKLKDASMVDVLEKMADLLGVTPILEPGLTRPISIDVMGVPISKALDMIGRAGDVTILVRNGVMHVRRNGAAPPLSDGATVPAASKPGFGEVVRFWRAGTEERPVDVRVPAYVARLELPGCEGPVTIARLGPWNEAAYRLVLSTRRGPSGRGTARIFDRAATDGTEVRLPGCDGRLVLAPGDASAKTVLEAKAIEERSTAVASMKILEIMEGNEESVSEPKVAFHAGAGWTVRTGFTADDKGTIEQEVEIHGVPLEFDHERGELHVAIFAGMVRGSAAKEGSPTLVARRAESFWLKVGRPLRWTIDSSWDGGRSALVLELTLDRINEARR